MQGAGCNDELQIDLYLLIQPLLPGEKRVKESWENRWVFGMSFNFLLALVIVLFKPDTRYVYMCEWVWSVSTHHVHSLTVLSVLSHGVENVHYSN